MKNQTFTALVRKVLSDASALLVSKGVEYSKTDDKLYNFKVVADADRTTPEKALWGMYMKHWASVRDLVHDMDSLPEEVYLQKWTQSKVREKIVDSINYHLLLLALYEERKENADVKSCEEASVSISE